MYVAIAFLLSLIRSKIATTDTDLADAEGKVSAVLKNLSRKNGREGS
jgi:hypothetical protein